MAHTDSTETLEGRRLRSQKGAAAVLALVSVLLGAVLFIAILLFPAEAHAAEALGGIGTAASGSVLAGQSVTNAGLTVSSGNGRVNPGTAHTGFPPFIVDGSDHAADAPAG